MCIKVFLPSQIYQQLYVNDRRSDRNVYFSRKATSVNQLIEKPVNPEHLHNKQAKLFSRVNVAYCLCMFLVVLTLIDAEKMCNPIAIVFLIM